MLIDLTVDELTFLSKLLFDFKWREDRFHFLCSSDYDMLHRLSVIVDNKLSD